MTATLSLSSRRTLVFAVGLSLLSLLLFVRITPADAHGTGLVELCERNSNAACTSAVFAVCDPGVPPFACSDPRDIEIRVSSFPANTTVNLWWLNGAQATDPTMTDCSQAVAMDRISLGSVTTDSTGKVKVNESLPRASWTTTADWNYGPNWVCGTTATLGGTGTVGDRLFTIYPA